MTANKILLDSMRGCMVGAVLGDCLGAPVECQFWFGIEKHTVRKRFDNYREKGIQMNVGSDDNLKKYTDDTAMARQVALSLINRNGLDVRDLAKRFVNEYRRESWRGYGASVGEVFNKLYQTNFESEEKVFLPASEQFNGDGSYGNGAAMRSHPIGLFGRDMLQVEKMAEQQSKLTHAHFDGITGGILQATAVHLAAKHEPPKNILTQLTAFVQARENEEMKSQNSTTLNRGNDNDLEGEELSRTYLQQLKWIEEMLEKDYSGDHVLKTLTALGNDIAALKSVPTALFCFLKAQDKVEGLFESNPFQRTLELAMSFGGDADTIMSMAGALAGAYYGEKAIPSYLINLCEGVVDAQLQADKLYELVSAAENT